MKKSLSWPVNLFKDIYGDNKEFVQEFSTEICKALHTLSEFDEDIILQRYRDKKAYKEIGIYGGITGNAVSARISRSISRLKEYFSTLDDKNELFIDIDQVESSPSVRDRLACTNIDDWKLKLFRDTFGFEREPLPDMNRAMDTIIDNYTQNDRERYIILCKYRDKKTLEWISNELDIGPVRVRQIIHKFIRTLRTAGTAGHNLLVFGMGLDMSKMHKEDILSQNIKCLGLNTHCGNVMARNRISTINDLVILTERDLMRMRGMGQSALNHIRERLSAYSLKLSGE